MWGGEVAGMAEGLASLPRDGRKLLILADSNFQSGHLGGQKSREGDGRKSNWGG